MAKSYELDFDAEGFTRGKNELKDTDELPFNLDEEKKKEE